MDPSRRQIYQMEDEDEALAKALRLSCLEHERRQSAPSSSSSGHMAGQSSTDVKADYGKLPEEEPNGAGKSFQGSFGGTGYGGTRNPNARDNKAVPLCLPNNCKWNSEARDYVKTDENRCSLYVVEEALERLRKVKGPVCVVSIAGSYRKGKSYILSEAFNQPDVFPLGHEMIAETMGIWLWVVPEKYKDKRGQEFSVVLLDSEGIDAATSDGRDDNQIFTLTVLLASVLIYNSGGVPTRHDLEGLDFIVKLSQRIQIRSNQDVTSNREEEEFFHRTFPFFLWLLRDVTQSIPRDCKDLKDYFLTKVFRDQDSARGQKVAKSILQFFPGFDAFHLSPPTADPTIMRGIHEMRSQLNPQFLTELEQFKLLLKSVLVPKHSCIDGQFVTGEGLAALVTLYVDAINTAGAIPNVQSAYETFVEVKCTDAKQISEKAYEERMRALLLDKMPCDNDAIRENHNLALKECQQLFMAETTGMPTNITERYLRSLKASLNEKLNAWQAENAQSTRESCNALLHQLKQQHLHPVLRRLQGSEGSKLTFDDIMGVYHRIKSDFDLQAVGAKDAMAATFFDFYKELREETKHCLEMLRAMKNYDEQAAKEIKMKAYQEQERRRLEEQQSRLQQENRENAVEMKMLIARIQEEREGLRQQMQNELEENRVQMQNMMAANMRQTEQERQAFMREKKAMEERFLEKQQSNEENMKMVSHFSELIAQHEKEKKELKANPQQLPQEELEGLLTEMNGNQKKEVDALLEKAGDMKDPDEEKSEKLHGKSEEVLPQMISERKERVANLRRQIEDTHQEQAEVEKPSFLKKTLKVVATTAPALGAVSALVFPNTAPYAGPISTAVSKVADALSEECSIM